MDDRVGTLRVAEQLDHPSGSGETRLGMPLADASEQLLVDAVGILLEERVVAQLRVL